MRKPGLDNSAVLLKCNVPYFERWKCQDVLFAVNQYQILFFQIAIFSSEFQNITIKIESYSLY